MEKLGIEIMKKYMVITVLSVAVLGMTSCGTKQENTKAEDSSSIIEVSASSEKVQEIQLKK